MHHTDTTYHWETRMVVEDGCILKNPTSCLVVNTQAVCSDPCKVNGDDVELLKNKVSKTHYPDSRWSWVVCFACFLSNVIMCGFAYSYGLLFPVLLDEFKAGKAKTAWLGSLTMLSSGLYGPVAGKLCDRFSSRTVAIFGGLLCAVGTVATSQAPSLNIMFVTYGIIFGIGSSFIFLSVFLIVPKYFVRRRSLALGILCMGPGGGLFIMSPLVQVLLDKYSWRGTFLVMSILFLGTCFLALTFDPNVTEVNQEEKLAPVVEPSSMSLAASLLQNRIYLIYSLASAVTYYGHYITVVHMVRHCEDLGISPGRASRLYLFSGLVSLIMRPLVGRLCDVTRITSGLVFQVATFGSSIATFLLPLATSYVHFVSYFVVYGIVDGSMGTSVNLVIMSSLNLPQRSLGFGIMQSTTAVSGIIGPVVAGFLADYFGSYYPAFYMSGASALLAASLMSLVYCVKVENKNRSKLEISQEQLIIVDKVSVV